MKLKVLFSFVLIFPLTIKNSKKFNRINLVKFSAIKTRLIGQPILLSQPYLKDLNYRIQRKKNP